MLRAQSEVLEWSLGSFVDIFSLPFPDNGFRKVPLRHEPSDCGWVMICCCAPGQGTCGHRAEWGSYLQQNKGGWDGAFSPQAQCLTCRQVRTSQSGTWPRDSPVCSQSPGGQRQLRSGRAPRENGRQKGINALVPTFLKSVLLGWKC